MNGQQPRTRLGFPVGLHFGSVIQDAGDVFGDTVNVAVRMAVLAKAGQIPRKLLSKDSLRNCGAARACLITRLSRGKRKRSPSSR
ncbi:MAG: hypothetical protein E2O38_00615 [Proteobacteria bacterium]|nr:MAG: hypothetical protein E2O38_00615 [Pseudomonadota bacterium]